MINSVRYENSQQVQICQQTTNMQDSSSSLEEKLGSGNILCTHDGVLLKKASAEYFADLNTSGALSLVEYTTPRRTIYMEWQPNENILVANDGQDQGDWALVDTISRRTRSISECKVFNTKPMDSSINGETMQNKLRVMRTLLDELASLEVKHRGQTIRFLRKSDGGVHSEFFFQHGNADMFVHSMRQLHFIDSVSSSTRGTEEYVILTTESQKLKKTFAELDIGEIKSSRLANESWLPNKVVGFLVNIPDYVQPPFHRGSPKSRNSTLVHGENRLSPNSYQIIGLSSSTNSSESSSASQSRNDKSPEDNKLENINENNEEIANTLPQRTKVERGIPLNKAQWQEFRMEDGRISDEIRIKEIVYRGGVEDDLRCEVWKYLLNYYKWSDTEEERKERCKQKTSEYYNMKAQWLSITAAQEANFSGYRDRKCQIEKDVKRTDRTRNFFAGDNNPNLNLLQDVLMTYVMYNFDLGYVQGMSDLLEPILEIQKKEEDAFWCFVGFMDMVFANFDIDQAGMKTQFSQLRRLIEFVNPRLFKYMQEHDSDNMYFCFRWLIVWYKREICIGDLLKLWECFWTRLPCPNFHLFFSLALLDQQTNTIIDNNYEFTEILKHVNELSGKIDVKHSLELAESIYLQLKMMNQLPNDIRKIIGESLLPTSSGTSTIEDDDFDEIIRDAEEKQREQELLEANCEQSIMMHLL